MVDVVSPGQMVVLIVGATIIAILFYALGYSDGKPFDDGNE